MLRKKISSRYNTDEYAKTHLRDRGQTRDPAQSDHSCGHFALDRRQTDDYCAVRDGFEQVVFQLLFGPYSCGSAVACD